MSQLSNYINALARTKGIKYMDESSVPAAVGNIMAQSGNVADKQAYDDFWRVADAPRPGGGYYGPHSVEAITQLTKGPSFIRVAEATLNNLGTGWGVYQGRMSDGTSMTAAAAIIGSESMAIIQQKKQQPLYGLSPIVRNVSEESGGTWTLELEYGGISSPVINGFLGPGLPQANAAAAAGRAAIMFSGREGSNALADLGASVLDATIDPSGSTATGVITGLGAPIVVLPIAAIPHMVIGRRIRGVTLTCSQEYYAACAGGTVDAYVDGERVAEDIPGVQIFRSLQGDATPVVWSVDWISNSGMVEFVCELSGGVSLPGPLAPGASFIPEPLSGSLILQ